MRGNKKSKIRKLPVRNINMQTSKKLVGLFLAVVLALVALAGRVVYINIVSGEDYTRIVLAANQQQYGSSTIAYKRGDILDRNGNILATSVRVYRLILDCSVVNYELTGSNGEVTQPYREATVNVLVEYFGLDEDEIYELLDAEETKSSQYQVLLTEVSMDEKEEFEDYIDLSDEEKVDSLTDEEYRSIYYINGIWFEEYYQRYYPQSSLASGVIGFANSSNEASWGIEGYYSDVLNGTDGRSIGYYNSDSEVELMLIEAENGNNVVSTIDINIQEIVRRKIEDFIEEYSNSSNEGDVAENIAVLVMDPDTGEILAMDSTGWYDLNNPRDLSEYYDEDTIESMTSEELTEALSEMWRNYCISDSFELGSTFKPIVVAAALETAAVTEADTFVCDGYETINGQIIRCSIYPEAHGEITLAESLTYSCNDALMQISYVLGASEFLRYQSVFNFGVQTGIDLPGESAGVLFEEDAMGTLELATASFGQGFTSTMLQEAAAMASLINGGYYYTPHVVKTITDSDGNLVENIDATLQTQTVSSRISDFIREALGDVVESGTARAAQIEGYSIGGKTGTAQKLPRSDETYLVSFIGFAPVDDPEVLVYVIIDEMDTGDSTQANSSYAVELAREIFVELLPYMNIYPETTE